MQRRSYGLVTCIAALLGALGAVVLAAPPARAALSQRPASTATFNGTVWTTAYADDTIYVGGEFTAALVDGSPVPRSRLAAIDARTGTLLRWAPKADAPVRSITVTRGSVYVAGQFSKINGERRDALARLDTVTGAPHPDFRHAITGSAYALASGSGLLYVGGSFTEVDGQRRAGLAAFRLSSGELHAAWRPRADDQVQALVATPSRIYIGGRFHAISGADNTHRLAAVNPTSGKVIKSFKVKADYIVYAIAVTDSRVYAAHGGQGGRVISYTLDGTARWSLTLDGDPRTVAVLGGAVYVGGHFDNVCRSARTGEQGRCLDGNIVRVKMVAVNDRGRVLPWRANANGVIGVLTMTANPRLGTMAAGGAFTTVNGKPQRRFAQFG